MPAGWPKKVWNESEAALFSQNIAPLNDALERSWQQLQDQAAGLVSDTVQAATRTAQSVLPDPSVIFGQQTPQSTPEPAQQQAASRSILPDPMSLFGQREQPQPTPSGAPSAMPSQPRTVDAVIQDGRTTPPTSGGQWTETPMRSTEQAPPATGDIDNSSRQSFIRTAWPYMLQAANGDQNLAELMLAKAISENGSIGTGKPFWANNFSGIKGEGDAGSVEADTWEDYGNGPVYIRDKFAAYSTPQAGMAAFMDFLRNNSRYHDALAQYQQTGDADALFDGILAAGYATDKQWANKVRSIRDSQVAPIVRGQQSDPRQSNVGAASSTALASLPTGAGAAGGPSPASAPGSVPPAVAQAFRAANGRDPSPSEAQELLSAFGVA